MPEIDITNVIQIDVSTPPAGLSSYNINNLAYFTKETPINAPDAGYAVYLTPSAVASDWGTNSAVYKASVAIFSQSPNILTGGGAFIVILMEDAELLATAIERTKNLVYYSGILTGFDPWVTANSDAETPVVADYDEAIAASNAVQSVNKILFLASPELDALGSNGIFAQIKAANNTHTRMLLYTVENASVNHRLMAAAYAGRAMSTNFSGSNTTATMHLKDLATITPDPLINETVITDCRRIGPDVYVNIAGLPKVFASGANDYFDNVYNLNWFKGAMEVAGFNVLATTSTKVPQTEPGMSLLKGAYRLVCEQALANGFISPGSWNSPELFGDPESLRRNVLERGYYIYSQPVNEQPQADREARKAPLIQIAIKFAGAIHSTNLIIYINR
ncbi:DUF3383 family protein [Ereboglobus luteus]|uniref:DUF3383 domain-containing protein n=1 Tax=Ereboglobus luteus TaxID=1796921 RepID=A0A2U8E636_9BACT|nr:DUF3383 family protein [Ereboglobus luteus]AWI10311.1 hypothetical protein CKA38_14555 [Ereboglobus luteus]